MKKLLLTALTLMCIFSYTLCAQAGEYDNIKVGLYYGDTAKGSVNISVSQGISYGYHDGTSHMETGTLNGNEFTISASSASTVTINDSLVLETGGSNLSVMPLDGNIKINGSEYRGGALFTNASDTTLCVMNVLPLEEYLYGVIASEMPSSWNLEALKAQALCARGFAVSNFNKHSSYGFNVCATTNCQVYKGVSAETQSTINAVDQTAGQVVMYEGKVIESLFYSSSGGHTANVKNVWGSSIPYLSGVEDPYESEDTPRHTWTATLTNAEIADALRQNGTDIGDLISLSALTDETGRTYELTAVGTLGTHTLKRQSTYSPFYSKGVLSQKFTIAPVTTGSRTLYAISKAPKNVLSSYTAINSAGIKANISSGFSIISAKGKDTYTSGTVTGYTFSGGGWGHGVGMSQYGAKGMADSGFTYDAILSHYYPGTEIGSIK
ncbi:MAG: SpoIID/LytB domain-containing protein [Clostridia bacterium]|nr:SpoIID/LytB domain-containing protein [Clostridia bacterium]